MAEKGVQTSDVVIDFLDEIRKPNGNKKSNTKTFEDIVPGAWGKLKLEETLDSVALEKLLINLILGIYDVEKATNNEEKRQTAQNRDVSLLMFGLLDGYYHTGEENGKKVDITSEKRYERYLNKGDFIKLDYPGEGTYQEIKAKDKKRNTKSKSAQPRPLNKLTKIAGDCKVEISRKLFELIKDGSYRQYIREVQGTDTVDASIILPKAYYTPNNFSPISEPESSQTDNSAEDDDIAQKESESENPAPESVTTENQYDRENGITAKTGSISSAEASSQISIHITNNIMSGQEKPDDVAPTKPDGAETGKATLKPKERMPKRWKWQLIISSVLGGVIAGYITSFVQRWLPPNINEDIEAGEDAPLVEEIYVFNNKFELPVGEKETLVIATNPPDADMDSVRCVVDRNPELVTIENDYDVRAQSQAEWLDEAEHTAVVLVQGGHAEKFPVEVTVINPRIYEDRAKDNLPNSEY